MTKHARRRILNTVLFAFIVSLASCNNNCNPTPVTSGIPDPFEVTGSGNHGEASVGVIAPGSGGACSNGRVYISSEGPNLVMRSLATPGSGPFDATFPAVGPLQENKFSSDNQIARLANGDLLLLWQGGTSAALSDGSTPDWWSDWLVNSKWEQDNPETSVDETQIDIPAVTDAKNKHPGRNGFRSAHLLWRFSAANCQWSTSPTAVDSGELSTILPSGLLQRGYCAQLAPGLAGFDRPELYVDPWGVNPNDPSKQRIYVSTFCGRCKTPPCPTNQGKALDDDNVQVYTSPDSGATWKPGMRLPPPQPVAMTSTPPNGRLFMFQVENGDGAKIYWSDPQADGTLGPAQGPFDVTYMPVDTKTNKNLPDPKDPTKPLRLLPGFLDETTIGVSRGTKKAVSLARTGNNAVLAVYPAVEEIPIAGSNRSLRRQVAAVVWVVTKGTNDCPIVVPMTIIRAQDPQGSVLLATFIEDDRSDAKNATSMLYWIETASRPALGEKFGMLARYMMFTNGILPGEEKLLSTTDGWQTRNSTVINDTNQLAFLGDYMKGGFYFHDGKLNFVPVWTQVSQTGTPPEPNNKMTQAFIRIISLQPPAPAAGPKAEEMPGAKPATAPPVKPGGTPTGGTQIRKGAEPCPTPTL